MNDSSTGGYIAPNALPSLLEDDDLTNALQQAIAGISGLQGDRVRPRWQAEPPNLPAPTQTWAAVGIVGRRMTGTPWEGWAIGDDLEHRMLRSEDLDVLCSFYGPLSESIAARTRDGLYIGQNREALQANGITVASVGDISRVPELINNRWLQRSDVPISMCRIILRGYPILDLTSAQFDLESQT